MNFNYWLLLFLVNFKESLGLNITCEYMDKILSFSDEKGYNAYFYDYSSFKDLHFLCNSSLKGLTESYLRLLFVKQKTILFDYPMNFEFVNFINQTHLYFCVTNLFGFNVSSSLIKNKESFINYVEFSFFTYSSNFILQIQP